MLFRTKVYVARAIREDRPHIPDAEAEWHDTVSYTFGINAESAAEAATIAVRAAENAVDRDGRYVGGVVLEVQPKCVGPEEFDGYERYLMHSLDQPGIFYVSGITFTSIALHEANGAVERLEAARACIEQNGIPAASFVHPSLKNDDEASRVRIVCPVCEHWVEVDNTGLLYSFFEGLDPFSDEYKEVQQAAQTAGPFVKSHFSCLQDKRDVHALIFLYEDDEHYNLLDESKRD